MRGPRNSKPFVEFKAQMHWRLICLVDFNLGLCGERLGMNKTERYDNKPIMKENMSHFLVNLSKEVMERGADEVIQEMNQLYNQNIRWETLAVRRQANIARERQEKLRRQEQQQQSQESEDKEKQPTSYQNEEEEEDRDVENSQDVENNRDSGGVREKQARDYSEVETVKIQSQSQELPKLCDLPDLDEDLEEQDSEKELPLILEVVPPTKNKRLYQQTLKKIKQNQKKGLSKKQQMLGQLRLQNELFQRLGHDNINWIRQKIESVNRLHIRNDTEEEFNDD